MSEDKRNIPKLRFPGFTDAWEQRKLGEIAKTTIGEFVIKTKQDDSYPYPVFNGGYSNTGFYNEFNNEGNRILVSARGANAGFVNIVKTRYWAGNSCYSIDLINKTEFDTDLIYQEMKRNQSRFTDNQQAANIPSVSKSDVEKFIIEVPEYAEQVKIANYFSNLDNLITLHQRKYEKLVNVKKSMLEKMFPENSSKIPEIRFKGFTEDWEQRKLKDITTIITKGTTPLDKSGEGNINFIKIENINPSTGIIESTSKITELEHNGYLKRSQLKEIDLLFSIAGTLGRVSLVNKGILPANTNQALAIIRLKECD